MELKNRIRTRPAILSSNRQIYFVMSSIEVNRLLVFLINKLPVCHKTWFYI